MKKNLLGFPLFILVLITLVVVSKMKYETKETNITNTKEEAENVNNNQPDNTKGKVIFDNLKNRVCEELNLCWISQGYNINGDKILRKEFPTSWGGKSVLLIPNEEWIKLSATNKKDLGEYLKNIGVYKIITGRVKPAEFSDGTINPSRNVIMVDETVWEF